VGALCERTGGKRLAAKPHPGGSRGIVPDTPFPFRKEKPDEQDFA
jgi:hypothetical protein